MKWRDGLAIAKDPQSIEPRGFGWRQYLHELDPAETIVASTWAVTPSGLTLASPSIVTGGLRTQVKLSAGTVGVEYILTNHITTSSGVQDERSVLVRVRNR